MLRVMVIIVSPKFLSSDALSGHSDTPWH